MTISTVIKSSGEEVPFDAEKLNSMAEWGSNVGICWSSLVLDAMKKVTDKCTTEDLQNALIDSCAEKSTPEHLAMASRLFVGSLYKKVHGGFNNRPDLYDFYHDMTFKGVWEYMDYDAYDLETLNEFIDHDKDVDYAYSTVKQIASKYAKKFKGVVCETPQLTFMGIAMKVMEKQPTDRRLDDVVKLYNYLSDLKINAPTPFLSGLRTSFKGYASCAVLKANDTAESLGILVDNAYTMTIASAGIGSTMNCRSLGDPVRGGAITHTGKIPYYRYLEGAVKSTKQSTRGGSSTTHYTILDPEIEDLVRLKHPTTVADKQVRGLDYSVGVNRLFAEKAASGQQWMLCSEFFAPEVYKALYQGYSEFKVAYNKYLASDKPKKLVDASDLLLTIMKQRQDTGRIYIHWLDEMNHHTPFKGNIYSSNLCVAPETMLLTSSGNIPIAELEGEKVDIWNGFEWSNVEVVKTGESKKLLNVKTTSGYELDCTPEHKFYVFTGYRKPYKEKRAHELVAGDKLMKFNLPVVEGSRVLSNAYQNGFYSADGSLSNGHSRIYLYHEKRGLLEHFPDRRNHYVQEDQNREYFIYEGLEDKFFVPNSEYTIQSRLDWLAGFLDGDGCIYRNGTNEAITGSSIEYNFLREVQLMLQTLGVSAKITKMVEEGYRLLPANDGTGELKEFWCQNSYRLLISSCDSYKLLTLGLNFNRLKIKLRKPQRDAKQFVKVESVTDLGRVDDTYCFTEHKRNLGMFNGILTGQCKEIHLPTGGFNKKAERDSYELNEDFGEIALCFLSSLVAGRISEEEYEDVAYYTALMIDNVIDIMEYPFKNLELTAKARRSIGIGVTNLAHDLAKRGLSYSSLEGKNYMHRHAEMHSYFVHKASLRLAKEKGTCEWITKTKYPEGWLPIDTYNKNVDNVHTQKLQYDWEGLRKDIISVGGLRNSVLEASPPCESSSLASQTTNCIYPIRDKYVTKKSGTTKVIFGAPDVETLCDAYEIAWDVPTRDLIDAYAIFQKFHGQGISSDLYTDFSKFPDEKVPSSKLFDDFFYSTKMGLKAWYYQNSKGGLTKTKPMVTEGTYLVEEEAEDDNCEACKM